MTPYLQTERVTTTEGDRMEYTDFLERRTQRGSDVGFEPLSMPPSGFDFQVFLTEWALRKGRAAIFADTGLGKTWMQLVWADNVVRKTNRNVLLLTPIAVSPQTVAEGVKFGITSVRSRDGKLPQSASIVITNYERLHYFNHYDFAGVVCDESSILKSFDGATRDAITAFMKKVPYRLLCTATAAPNDYTELGTSSEALGYLGYVDMLTRFFKNGASSFTSVAGNRYFSRSAEWCFKGHAELPFWRWVCSWARAIRMPSDIGFSDKGFVLPPLTQTEHVIEHARPRGGMMFNLPAIGLNEQREERRNTIDDRCEKVADLVNNTGKPALVWCHLNDEGKKLDALIPDAVEISGADDDDTKEEAFMGFVKGDVRVLITKPTIGAWGLNFQHCAHVTLFPSHSYEQTYQGIRRCWRFGQKNPVQVDVITSPGEKGVLDNLLSKQIKADKMFANLTAEMNRAVGIEKKNTHTKKVEVPSWL